MTPNIVVDASQVVQVVQEWLKGIAGKNGPKLEVYFLPGEMIIRPHSSDQVEFDALVDSIFSEYDDVFRRLAE